MADPSFENPVNDKTRMQRVLQTTIAIIFGLLFIAYLFNRFLYEANWLKDILSGRCFWWSLGFICRGG